MILTPLTKNQSKHQPTQLILTIYKQHHECICGRHEQMHQKFYQERHNYIHALQRARRRLHTHGMMPRGQSDNEQEQRQVRKVTGVNETQMGLHTYLGLIVPRGHTPEKKEIGNRAQSAGKHTGKVHRCRIRTRNNRGGGSRQRISRYHHHKY